MPFKAGGNMPARNMGERLAVDPNLNSILFFAARSGNGLWKSTNSGLTWSQVTSFPQPGTYAVLPGDVVSRRHHWTGVGGLRPADRILGKGYADHLCWRCATRRHQYLRHHQRWNHLVRAGWPTDLHADRNPNHRNRGLHQWRFVVGSFRRARAPASCPIARHLDSVNGLLYITYSNGAGPYDGTMGDVQKYNTATGVWTEIAPVVPTTASGADYFGYCGLTIDKQVPTTLMVSAFNSWWPDTIIWRSTNSGATWSQIWNWTSYPSRSLLYTLERLGRAMVE